MVSVAPRTRYGRVSPRAGLDLRPHLGHGNVYCEEIFLLMLIPGIDMFRLFINRIIKGKNPFLSDNQHLHHLYLNKFSQNLTVFIIQLHIFIPILIFNLYNSVIIVILFVSIFVYLISIFYIKLIIKN